MMTSKQRMLTALAGGLPDRLPATIHQWQSYHLRHYMDGLGAIEAFRRVGLDASHTPGGLIKPRQCSNWQVEQTDLGVRDGTAFRRVAITTPDGTLTQITGADAYTTYAQEHLVKTIADMEILLKHMPGSDLDKLALSREYDLLGDDGIVRGFVWHASQPGPWQELCSLVGTEQAIYWAVDHPTAVHYFLQEMTNRKVHYIHEQMAGARYDLIEHGGGAASANVISPAMFDEFCVPYDRQVIEALHQEGFGVVYHTCGHMMAILEHIPANGCDASETLSPPGVGGDLATSAMRTKVKQVLGAQVQLIGGIDQSRLDQPATAATQQAIAADVRECFETFGLNGGYICSAADHFFHAPVENLVAFARTAAQCRYGG